METAITNTNEAPAIKPRRRWHWTTWVIGTLGLAVGFTFNLLGDLNEQRYEIEHGWPWAFEAREYPQFKHCLAPNPTWSEKWLAVRNRVKSFSWATLLVNLGVVCLLSLAACLLWEMRNHRLKRWYQFTLLDWFVFCALFAGGYAVLCDLYADRQRDQRLTAILLRINQSANAPIISWGPDFPLDYGQDYPFDWLWELLFNDEGNNGPSEMRPFRRVCMDLGIDAGPPNFKGGDGNVSQQNALREAFQLISRYPNLEVLNLDCHTLRNFPPSIFLELRNSPWLKEVNLKSSSKGLTAEQFAVISQLHPLKSLDIDGSFELRGVPWSHLQQVESLSLCQTDINDQGLLEISQLTGLKALKLWVNPNISATGWEPLASLQQLKSLEAAGKFSDSFLAIVGEKAKLRKLRLSSQNIQGSGWQHLAKLHALEELHITAESFNDAAISSIKHLPKLRVLELTRTSVTKHSWDSINKMRSLAVLIFQSRNSRFASAISRDPTSETETLPPFTEDDEWHFRQDVGDE